MKIIRTEPFKNRIGLWDFYKGLLMIYVVVAHAWSNWIPFEEAVLFNRTSAAAMGCFFILSGYSFKKSSPGECLKKQARQYLPPYILMAVCSIAIVLVKNLLMRRNPMPKTVACVLGFGLAVSRGGFYGGRELGGCGTGWFLLALFLSWNLLNLIFQMDREWHRALAVVLLWSMGLLVRGLPQWIFCITQSLNALVFLYTGYLLKKEKFFQSKIPGPLFALLGVCAGIALVFGMADFSNNIWSLGVFSLLGSLAAAILALKAYTCLVVPDSGLTELVMKIGRYSYWIMVIHGIDIAGVQIHLVMRRLELPIYLNRCLLLTEYILFICGGCAVAEVFTRLKAGGRLGRGWDTNK